MEIVVGVVVGIVVAGVVAVVLSRARRGTSDAVSREMRRAVETLVTQSRGAMEAERRLSDEVLDGKKSLIDAELGEMRSTLERLQEFMHQQEHRSHQTFGQVVTHLEETARQTQALTATTQSLREALSSTTARGQWGERMAEDVLQLAGFVKDVNYRKHQVLEGSGGMPDYTFMLPQGLSLHMDVKFPLNSYLRFLDAGSDIERERWRKEFLKDVRARVKELTTREYIDAAHGTVDCMLLFIPNEQVYGFIQEQDRDILDDALRSKIVFCSPLTLSPSSGKRSTTSSWSARRRRSSACSSASNGSGTASSSRWTRSAATSRPRRTPSRSSRRPVAGSWNASSTGLPSCGATSSTTMRIRRSRSRRRGFARRVPSLRC